MESTLRKSAPEDLSVIETLRFDPEDGFSRLGMHIDRAERTCGALDYDFDRAAILQKLGGSVGDTPVRCRIRISQNDVSVEVFELAPTPDFWRVGFGQGILESDDPWLQVKTNNRAFYDTARAQLPQGIDEVLFLNERGEVCEGTITNVFLKMADGFVTPALSSGVLPGVLRQELIETGRAVERVVSNDDLLGCDEVYVGNSLRGLIRAHIQKTAP